MGSRNSSTTTQPEECELKNALLVVVFFIIGFFNQKFLIATEICLGLDLFMMAYNNYLIYRRRNMTIIYIVIGVLALLSALLGVV